MGILPNLTEKLNYPKKSVSFVRLTSSRHTTGHQAALGGVALTVHVWCSFDPIKRLFLCHHFLHQLHIPGGFKFLDQGEDYALQSLCLLGASENLTHLQVPQSLNLPLEGEFVPCLCPSGWEPPFSLDYLRDLAVRAIFKEVQDQVAWEYQAFQEWRRQHYLGWKSLRQSSTQMSHSPKRDAMGGNLPKANCTRLHDKVLLLWPHPFLAKVQMG